MTNNLKLCPIEPTSEIVYAIESKTSLRKNNAIKAYTAMTKDCQTVREVDVEGLREPCRTHYCEDEYDRGWTSGHDDGWNACLEYLIEENYIILERVEDD